MGRIVRQTTPSESAKILFVGSGYQFAKRTLERIADNKSCEAEDRKFVERFLGNSLLMVTHWAWAGNGWGVGPFAHLVKNNPHFHDLLKELMPFQRGDVVPRIKEVWPKKVAEIFKDVAGSEAQQRKLESLAGAHRVRGDAYRSVAMYLGQTDRKGQEFVYGRLMHARFRLVDSLIPAPNLTPENAQRILQAWATSKQPNSTPADEMGVPLFHMRFEKRTGPV